MQRNYKACEPDKTIQKIRGILGDLDIFLRESNWSHGDGLFNCRLAADNDSLYPLGIGTNGKGRSYEYSLASGYAEFMERIENGIRFDVSSWICDLTNIANNIEDEKFKNLINEVLAYYKSSKTETFDEIWDQFSEDIKRLFPGIDSKEKGEKFFSQYFDTKAIPVSKMYSIDDHKTEYYPLLLARVAIGTSGLCSGNTPYEAILHGFCEIFERYVTLRIFKENLTPPTIPVDTYKNTSAWHTIKRLERERGLEIILKDCSLGMELPVIGILVIDPKKQIYNFKLGSEFVPEIALERCLTEAFQTSSDAFKSATLQHYHSVSESKKWYGILKRGYGAWPLSIFANKPSFDLWEFDKNYGKNDKDDMQTCLKLCKKLDTRVYIRDNSFLGFPSYQLIAPSLSGLIYSLDNIPESICYMRKQMVGSVFANGVPNEEVLADYLENKAKEAIATDDKFNINNLIPFYCNDTLGKIDAYYVLSLVSYMRGDNKEAYDYICKCLESGSNVTLFYHAIADYLDMKLKELDESSIIEILVNKYGRSTAMLLWTTFSDPKDVLSRANILYHFDFNDWTENSDSHLYAVLNVVKRIQERNSVWNPDYDKLAEMFV